MKKGKSRRRNGRKFKTHLNDVLGTFPKEENRFFKQNKIK